jgi:hypothetical protein
VNDLTESRSSALDRRLLLCGALSAAGYVATDLLASGLYPGYSIRAQAVSELFAIGAPTSALVVPLFTLCSLLLLAFAVGLWRTSGGRRTVHVMAAMFVGSALVGLAIWNLFPMHMRGAERSFTDSMHLILATNPFVLLSLVLAIAAYRGIFRAYSIATVVLMVVPAVAAFSYAKAIELNQPTPWLGALERLAQYGFEAWQVVLALMLWRKHATSATSELSLDRH